MAVPSLELSGISKRYPGVQALDRVDFECRPGEIHAVLGENGSGKSTLLGIAGGAVAADEGRVTIMGKPLTAADPLLARQLGLAVVYQDNSLVRELTVAENLLLGVRDGAEDASAASANGRRGCLLPTSSASRLTRWSAHLSASQRQFLEIVKALAANPKVLLLDEPTSSLDISGVEKLSEIIRRIVAAGAGGGLCEPPAAGDPGARQPRHHPPRRRRPGHLRGRRAAVGERSDRADGRAADRGGISGASPGDALGRDRALGDETLSGRAFHDLALEVRRGEILGFAGSEGNGQREALRALGGLKTPTARCCATAGRSSEPAGRATRSTPASSRSAPIGRRNRSLPRLGVRENMTVQVLDEFAAGGLISAPKERARRAFAGRKAQYRRRGSRSADRRALRRQSAESRAVAEFPVRGQGAC